MGAEEVLEKGQGQRSAGGEFAGVGEKAQEDVGGEDFGLNAQDQVAADLLLVGGGQVVEEAEVGFRLHVGH